MYFFLAPAGVFYIHARMVPPQQPRDSRQSKIDARIAYLLSQQSSVETHRVNPLSFANSRVPQKGISICSSTPDKQQGGELSNDNRQLTERTYKETEWYCPDGGGERERGIEILSVPSAIFERGLPEPEPLMAKKVFFILSSLLHAHWRKRGEKEHWTHWHRDHIRRLVNRGWDKQVMQWLEDNGVIEVKHSYLPKSLNPLDAKTKAYRITKPYHGAVTKIGCRDKHIVRVIGELRREAKEVTEYKAGPYKDRIPEYKRSMEMLEHAQFPPESMGMILDVIEGLETEAQKSFYRYVVDSFQNGDFYVSIDRKTGRMFNNLTNCPRLLRPFLRYDKEGGMAEADVSGSQIVFMGQLLPRDHPEWEAFHDLALNGDFYMTLAKDAQCDQFDRDDCKRWVYQGILFGKSMDGDFWRAFHKRFPALADKVAELKRKDYKRLARLLQMQEADLMIGKVCRQLRGENILAATIHDSVVCLDKDVERVRQVILDAFDEVMGVRPNVKVKRYSESLLVRVNDLS